MVKLKCQIDYTSTAVVAIAVAVAAAVVVAVVFVGGVYNSFDMSARISNWEYQMFARLWTNKDRHNTPCNKNMLVFQCQ